MAERNWMNVEETPLHTTVIDPEKISMPTFEKRLKEALLGIADLAYGLQPGESMVVKREGDDDHDNHRLFTVKIYSKK